jgi:PAS domain S-box-containing protein
MSFNFDTLKEAGLHLYKDFEFEADNIKDVIEDNFDSLRIALDNLPIDFWLKDKDHRYLYMNAIMLKRTGINEGEYYLKNDFELFDKQIANDFVTSDLEAIRSKKKTQYTFEAQTARFVKWTEVSKVPLYNVRGESIGLIGCAIDISESKNNEQKLLEENKVWLEVISTMFDIVLCTDSVQNICQFYSTIIEDSERFLYKPYKEIFSTNRQFISFIDAAYNGIESEFTTMIDGASFHITVKPLKIDDTIHKIILYGRKNGGE